MEVTPKVWALSKPELRVRYGYSGGRGFKMTKFGHVVASETVNSEDVQRGDQVPCLVGQNSADTRTAGTRSASLEEAKADVLPCDEKCKRSENSLEVGPGTR